MTFKYSDVDMDTNRFRLVFVRRHKNGDSWREIGKDFDLDPAMTRLIANGYEPGNKIREKLGLVPMRLVKTSKCSCGEYFIPNHPSRVYCFTCHPFRSRKE